MQATLTAVVLAAAVTALAALLAPEGKNKKWVTFVFSVVSFAVVCAPLVRLIRDGIPSLDLPSETESAAGSAFSYVLGFAEEPLRREVADAVGLSADEISLTLTETPQGGLRAEAVVPAGWETAVEGCLREKLSKDCEVIVRGR